jgi:hypothetical protein
MKNSILNFINNFKMVTMIRFVFITNLIDAALTITWVKMGIAIEANPLMKFVLELGPEWFVGCKITLILLACIILWHLRHLTAAKVVAFLSCLLYLGIIGIHLVGFIRTIYH